MLGKLTRVQPTHVMPVPVAVRFAHAVAQAVAEEHGVRLLHIKGPAVDQLLLDSRLIEGPAGPEVEAVPRESVDADVWVSPSDIDTFLAAMADHGWVVEVEFEDGSAFEHAATLGHPVLGHIDVHRSFPGIELDRQQAFDLLWKDRAVAGIAGRPCAVPAVTAQRIVLILHRARGGVDSEHPDIRCTWGNASEPERGAVRTLAGLLRAEVALAAGTGELETFRGRREYWLWRILADGSENRSQLTVWAARVRATAPPERLRTALRLLLPKPQRLRVGLGRPPTRGEVLRAYGTRLRLGVRELGKLIRPPR